MKVIPVLLFLSTLSAGDLKTGAGNPAIRIVKAASAKPVIPPGTAWLAVLPDAHLAWTTGGQWTTTRVSLPAEGARIWRSPEGVVHAVWADHKGIAHSTSEDLMMWSAPMTIDIMADKNALDLNSPNLFYDGRQFIVTWSCTLAKNAIQASQDVEANPRMWYATTRDFETMSEPKVLFDNNYAVREAQILPLGTRYALIHTDSSAPMQNLRVAFADTPLGPWGPSSDAFTAKGTASPAAIRSGEEWWIYHSGGLLRTRDFWTFNEVPLPSAIRPISVIEAPRSLTK